MTITFLGFNLQSDEWVIISYGRGDHLVSLHGSSPLQYITTLISCISPSNRGGNLIKICNSKGHLT